jgi:hypothetical protein
MVVCSNRRKRIRLPQMVHVGNSAEEAPNHGVVPTRHPRRVARGTRRTLGGGGLHFLPVMAIFCTSRQR